MKLKPIHILAYTLWIAWLVLSFFSVLKVDTDFNKWVISYVIILFFALGSSMLAGETKK